MKVEKFDPEGIRRAVNLLMEPGSTHEVRAPGTRQGTVSGYFDDPNRLAQAAAKLSGRAAGTYVTLNPVKEALLARAANRTVPYARYTTADKDITRRCWLPIDFDPVRPAGISSTDEEHAASVQRARICQKFLAETAFPDPILADSGNGAHLLYRIDLPNEDESTALVRCCLEAIALRFSDSVVEVDLKTFNASRIWKLYGTFAAKGDATPERPHRLARLLAVPPRVEVVSRDLLEKLAALAPNPAKGQPSSGPTTSGFDLESWIKEHELDVLGPHPWQGGRKWIIKVCPWDREHSRSAFVVQFGNGAIAAGCHHDSCQGNDWHALRDAIEPGWRSTQASSTSANRKRSDRSQASQLVELAMDSKPELFHTPGGEGYTSLSVEGHRETWPLKSSASRTWLARLFFTSTGRVPSSQVVRDALAVLEGEARFQGAQHPIFIRVACHGGRLFLDLVNQDWEVVEITAAGWQVVTDVPVRFRRRRGMLALPNPAASGSIEDLRHFVNVREDGDWMLLQAWLVGALRAPGPFPVLTLCGEQGSAKSTTARVLRALVDPNSAPLRAEPRNGRDLMIAASNGWVLGLDNLSHLPGWLSNSLCRLATGGGFSTRELYSDDEEVIFDAMRPVILTGIEELATRGDLLDRSIILSLPNIPEERRRPEGTFWGEFEQVRAQVLGALLDAVSAGLQNLPHIQLSELPRMADFAVWATAAEPALQSGQAPFMAAYTRNREESNELALEASALTPYLLKVAAGSFNGTATELLERLETQAPEKVRAQRSWPKSARSLSGKLRWLAPNFREIGVNIEFIKTAGQGSRKLICVAKRPGSCNADDICDAPEGPNNGVCVAASQCVAKIHPLAVQAEPGHVSVTDGLDSKPRPNEQRVRCRDCSHFIPDPAGCNGIGQCSVEGEGTRSSALPLFPDAQRHCRDFLPLQQVRGVGRADEMALET